MGDIVRLYWCLITLGLGCTPIPVVERTETTIDLVRADSCDTLRTAFAEHLLETMLQRYDAVSYPFDWDTISEEEPPPPTPL